MRTKAEVERHHDMDRAGNLLPCADRRCSGVLGGTFRRFGSHLVTPIAEPARVAGSINQPPGSNPHRQRQTRWRGWGVGLALLAPHLLSYLVIFDKYLDLLSKLNGLHPICHHGGLVENDFLLRLRERIPLDD